MTMSIATKARYEKPQPYRGVLARFPRAILEIAKVSAYGTVKHELPMGDVSYLDIPGAEVNFVEAEVRHLLHEAIHGPVNEEDGDLLHKAQKAWEALADLEVYLYQREQSTLPDPKYRDEFGKPNEVVPTSICGDPSSEPQRQY